MTTTIAARTGNKISFRRNGKLYGATLDSNGHAISIMSYVGGGSKVQFYNRDRHHALYADLEAAL